MTETTPSPVAGRSLRAQAADEGRRGQAADTEASLQTFETAIIERYRRRESSVEEALIAPCRGYHRGAVGHASVAVDGHMVVSDDRGKMGSRTHVWSIMRTRSPFGNPSRPGAPKSSRHGLRAVRASQTSFSHMNPIIKNRFVHSC
jgi:hypothetical protein